MVQEIIKLPVASTVKIQWFHILYNSFIFRLMFLRLTKRSATPDLFLHFGQNLGSCSYKIVLIKECKCSRPVVPGVRLNFFWVG